MNITEQKIGDVVVAKIQGKFDAATTPTAESTLYRLLAARGVHLILDLSDVSYMSSAGIRLLLNLVRQARRQSGALRLAGVQPQTKRTLELVGLVPIFPLHGDVAAALGAFHSATYQLNA